METAQATTKKDDAEIRDLVLPLSVHYSDFFFLLAKFPEEEKRVSLTATCILPWRLWPRLPTAVTAAAAVPFITCSKAVLQATTTTITTTAAEVPTPHSATVTTIPVAAVARTTIIIIIILLVIIIV